MWEIFGTTQMVFKVPSNLNHFMTCDSMIPWFSDFLILQVKHSFLSLGLFSQVKYCIIPSEKPYKSKMSYLIMYQCLVTMLLCLRMQSAAYAGPNPGIKVCNGRKSRGQNSDHGTDSALSTDFYEIRISYRETTESNSEQKEPFTLKPVYYCSL